MSLRFRINLIITVVTVLFSLVMAKVVVDDMRSSIREEMEAGTKVTLQLMSAVLYGSQLVPRSKEPFAVLLPFLHNLGRVRAHEIRLYADDGTLVYTSPPPVYKAGRAAPAWFSRVVSPDLREQELKVEGGRIRVTPDASRAVLDAWDDMRNLMGLVVGFLLLVNAAVFWLLGRALRPVAPILRGLSEMERGRLSTRLPAFSLREFDSISHTFNRMAQTLEESHAENMRLALVAKQSTDAIMVHDLEGHISFWNPAAERLFGYTPEQIVGRSATLLTPPGLEAEVAGNLQTIRARRVVDNVETRRLTCEGRIVDVALSAAPMIEPSSGEVIGEICSMRDITDRKRAQETEKQLEQNRQLTRVIQTHLEEERRSIARELHDELGQSVTAIKTIGAAIANRTQSGAPDIHRSAQTIVEVAGRIYDAVHGIIRQLRPSALDNLGLQEAVEDMLNTWRERHPEIGCHLAMTGELADLGESVNITAYRLIQECLTNVLRHADASRVDVELLREAGAIKVSVCDDGKGLAEGHEAERARFGLMGIRERVQALRGEFELESLPGEGLKVSATIPVASPAQGDTAASSLSALVK
jgi:hypothetical protein